MKTVEYGRYLHWFRFQSSSCLTLPVKSLLWCFQYRWMRELSRSQDSHESVRADVLSSLSPHAVARTLTTHKTINR